MERTKTAWGRRGLEWHRKDRIRREKKRASSALETHVWTLLAHFVAACMAAFVMCVYVCVHARAHSNEIAAERRAQFTYLVTREREDALQDRLEIF